ncbi:MAG TPA: methyltransferase domain-containing protein [Candidatus Acidoferrales bacterium]|nr:methyltransferase domain-containing protein [Candidatus Acidoferrales bacterium]
MDARETKQYIASAYNAAADRVSSTVMAHRDYFGARTVERLALHEGEFVLDVCCGAGASAIPAARAVGPKGRVIGVDIAEAALARARERAAGEGLANVEFRHADFDKVYFRAGSFDALVSVFGIFFLPDMAEGLRKMWRFLRPGGRLAVTTRGPEVFEPANTLFWDAVRRERPDLYKTFTPWELLTSPEQVRGLFDQAGIGQVEIETEDHPHLLESAEDFWTLAMGTGYRGTIDRLTGRQRERVRSACLTLEARSLRSPVLYALAYKP